MPVVHRSELQALRGDSQLWALGTVGILQVSELAVARSAGAVLAFFLSGACCSAGDFLENPVRVTVTYFKAGRVFGN